MSESSSLLRWDWLYIWVTYSVTDGCVWTWLSVIEFVTHMSQRNYFSLCTFESLILWLMDACQDLSIGRQTFYSALRTHTHMHTHEHTHTLTNSHTYAHTYTHTHAYIHTYMRTRTCTQMYTHTRADISIERHLLCSLLFTHTHIHTYTHAHTHTHIHAHTHSHTYI